MIKLKSHRLKGGRVQGGIDSGRVRGGIVLACIFFTHLIAYRTQSRFSVDLFVTPPPSTTTTLESDLVPPPPPVVLNTTFFTLPEEERQLTPLRFVDREQYTLRILSWKRAQFLAASVSLHSQCPGVKQIQVVWSILQEDDNMTTTNPDEITDNRIPAEVLENPKVVVERRTTNRLNNRFDILPTTPTSTLGIVILDDDLIYTCEALDMDSFCGLNIPIE
ncbi:exostoses (multiple)-like 2 [Seminavis robusta]|uniref:Exostoses (Multiple)-like 2 n=1 Tax=Seminavis robusta TaxID=568900 RepID=A0A9N8EYN0_9STRA|nr:exostoses (multiple)-like 2 [Seminavis robusta]|eukprot:Sro1948_g307260.1 exostoses (multiple)-like 2 (220) ;mRNA; r:19670-20329